MSRQHSLPPPNVAIRGNRVHLLNEQDPDNDEDDIDDFKYLGILLTSDELNSMTKN